MTKKTKEFIIIITAIIVLVILGLLIYQRYTIKDKENVENNYYNEEYLFNNGYIKNPKDIEDLDNNIYDIYMYLDKENTLYIRDIKNSTSKQVTGLPINKELKVYYNILNSDNLELISQYKNELYYAKINMQKTKKYKFNKISNEAKEIYVIVDSNNTKTSEFIINTTSEELKTIINKNNKDYLSKSIEKINPYFDYICYDKDKETCNKTKIYITFDKKIVINNKIIKNKNNKDIIIKDIFGTVGTNENKKNYVTIYAIDSKNRIYQIKNNKVELYTKKKVEDVKFSTKDNKIEKIYITFKDNSSNVINGNNNYIITSTLYDKEN